MKLGFGRRGFGTGVGLGSIGDVYASVAATLVIATAHRKTEKAIMAPRMNWVWRILNDE